MGLQYHSRTLPSNTQISISGMRWTKHMYKYLAYLIDLVFQVSGLFLRKIVKLLAATRDLIYLVVRFSLVTVHNITVWNYGDSINVDTKISAF